MHQRPSVHDASPSGVTTTHPGRGTRPDTLRLARCGTTMAGEDRGMDNLEDPPLDDRCAVCQGAYARGETVAR